MTFHRIAAAAALALGLVAGAQASTTILNISATTGIPVTQTFGPGTYTVNWIDNTANGGFNGWIYNTGATYREAFTVSGLPGSVTGLPDGSTISIDKSATAAPQNKFQSYATAAAALAAVQSGPYSVYYNATDGTLLTSMLGAVTFTLTSAANLTFSIPDQYLGDNCCGVSLAISNGVPEPGSYPLALAGIGALALVSRRRKSV